MENKLISSYKNFEKQSYDISSIEFEILQVKLKLSFSMSDEQLKYLEKYDRLTKQLLSKKENKFIQFVLSEIKKK